MKTQKLLLVLRVLLIALVVVANVTACGSETPTAVILEESRPRGRDISSADMASCKAGLVNDLPGYEIEAVYAFTDKATEKGKTYHSGDTIPIPISKTGIKTHLLLKVSGAENYLEEKCSGTSGPYAADVYIYSGKTPEGGLKLHPLTPTFNNDSARQRVNGDHYDVCRNVFWVEWSISGDYMPEPETWIPLDLVVGHSEYDAASPYPAGCFKTYDRVSLVLEAVPVGEEVSKPKERVAESPAEIVTEPPAEPPPPAEMEGLYPAPLFTEPWPEDTIKWEPCGEPPGVHFAWQEVRPDALWEDSTIKYVMWCFVSASGQWQGGWQVCNERYHTYCDVPASEIQKLMSFDKEDYLWRFKCGIVLGQETSSGKLEHISEKDFLIFYIEHIPCATKGG